VSQLCEPGTSSCNGGLNPGVEEYVYEGTGVLPPGCPNLTYSWSLSARTGAITNLTGGGATYLEAVINTSHPQWGSPCNSSPQFTNIPVIYACANQNTIYSPGAIDPDGDSLVFSVSEPLNGSGSSIAYGAGFSIAEPFCTNGTFSINSSSGEMSFVSCTGQAEVCRGQTIDFTVLVTDPDPNDTLTVTSNIGLAPIGGIYTTTGIGPVTVNFTVNASNLLPGNYPFTITVNDGACPVPSIQTLGYVLTVSGIGYSQQVYCKNDSNPSPIIFGATGGTFQVVSGGTGLVLDPITGIIDLDNSLVGSYQVLYVTSVGPCPGTDSVDIEIIDIPDPSFSYQPFYCVGNANPFPVITGNAGGIFSNTTGKLI